MLNLSRGRLKNMKLKIKEIMTTISLPNKESVQITSDENNLISKFCESITANNFDIDTLIQRGNSEWSDKQKMLLIKRLVAIDNDIYKHLNFNNTYRRSNFYFQHRKIIPSTGIYDCGIDPFNYKFAIGAVSFTNPKRVPVSSSDVGVF